MISEREKNILKIIVEEYIKTAKPVSSSHICNTLKCSSATVRNEMVYLEELGYLEKNHFASGRIPSESGYKYYVDNLMKPKEMTGEDMLKLQTIFNNQSLALSDTIKKSIEIISEITNYTTVVLGTKAASNRLKQVEIVPLEESKILTIVITDKGAVEHKNLYLPSTISTEEVKKTVELINRLLVGTPINEVSEKLEYEIKPIIGKYVKQHEILYNAFYDAFSEFTSGSNNDVHYVGKNNFLKQPEFNNVDKVKEILSKFDDINAITTEENNGINIYIGSESEISDDTAVIKTKYNYNGEEGTIAIVGPKRMEYDKVVSLLDYVKNNIGGTMSKKHKNKENSKKQEQEFEKNLEDNLEEMQEQLDDDYEDEAHNNEVEELNKKIKDLQEALLRNQAELQNYKRRKDEEYEKSIRYKNEDIIKELLNIIDNFERAIKMDNQDLSDEVSKFLEGFKLIYTNMINILNNYDVKEIATDGIEFDPDIHHAVLTEHDETKPAGVVLEILQKGYTYKDRVIRPAMVKVNE